MIILTAIFGYIAHAINYLWHISHSALNKLMHALHGNGVINRIYTAGMPTLKSNSTIEDYVSWHIDFTAWTKGQGAYGCIIEAPARPADADAQAKDEQEGLRYLAAARRHRYPHGGYDWSRELRGQRIQVPARAHAARL